MFVCLFLGQTGCQRPTDIESQNMLSQARRQIDQEAYAQAIDLLNTFISRNPRSHQIGDAYYLRGLCFRRQGPGQEDAAEGEFQKALETGRDQNVKQAALTALGHIYFESDPPRYNTAVEYYEKVVEMMDDTPPKDVVLYRLGVSLQGLGRWLKADLYFSQCMHLFEDSQYGEYSRRRFGAKVFSIQVAALSDLGRTEKMVSSLQRAGEPAFWSMKKKSDNRILYEIRVGSFPTFQDARNNLSNLTRQFPDAIIVVSKAPDHL